VTRPSVVVVGDATLDVHVSPVRPLALGSDVPAEVRMRPGGQGANLAVRLARQGVPVTLVCALGDDAAAGMIRAALDAEGVTLVKLPCDATGVVVVLGGASGERSMLSHRAPLPPFAADAAATLGDWLLVSGYPLSQPDAFELARRLSDLPMRRVLVACAVAEDALSAWRAAVRELRPDLVVANREEAEAARLGELAPALAVNDAAGAEVNIGMVRAAAATPEGPPAVDTTGAGDAFAARLVAGLLDAEWPPSEALLRDAVGAAVELASAVARVQGAQAVVPGERVSLVGP
jgi:ribokinase